MSGNADMDQHFTEVSSIYREVRTTDLEPVAHISRALGEGDRVQGADIGCGDGRYDLLMFEAITGLRLTCVDANQAMLNGATELLSRQGIDDFETRLASAEEWVAEPGSYDFVASFNAVHHFDLGRFLAAASQALASEGHLFVYTRLPEQNSRTIWGRYFPGFIERETRLYNIGDLHAAIEATRGLRFENAMTFRYPRQASLEKLIEQALHHHYSTFSLYGPGELDDAVDEFRKCLSDNKVDFDNVRWYDENIMIHAHRDAG